MAQAVPGVSLGAHSSFFDRLVELIPARFYHGGEELVHLVGMKKAERAAAKQDLKAKAKDNKRAKLDPNAPSTSLAVQQLQRDQAQAPADGSGTQPSVDAPSSVLFGQVASGSSLSREELQAKLQAKIQSVRLNRDKKKEKQAVAQQSQEWRDKTLENNVKQKQAQAQAEQLTGSKRKAEAVPSAAQDSKKGKVAAQAAQPVAEGQPQQHSKKVKTSKHTTSTQEGAKTGSSGEEPDDFQFTRMENDAGKPGRPKPNHKKMSKEELLKLAEAKQEAAVGAAATKEGRVSLINDAWTTALSRASGQRVLDDPKLLRKSLKKEAKRKEKSTKAWEERTAGQQEHQDRRQQKRTDNIQGRADKKLEAKKAAREKKLLRAGFEGRKTGFIGGKSPAAGKS
mmetsp:Transcript_15557/g.26906  ORF Transcript_15557/g.26906 Transcript_15557/m.26906 type:complete len:396 (-) Transcript_15557:734-1921(-)